MAPSTSFHLGARRDDFELPANVQGEPLVYLCGHSLGALPHAARKELNEGIRTWATRAVDGHFEGERPWFHLGEDLRTPMAKIVGATPADVALHGSLTGNLHLLLRSFYQPQGQRTKLMIEYGSFPSDRFCARSHVASRSLDPDAHVIEVKGQGPHGIPRNEEILAAIKAAGDTLATVMLPGVSYVTGGVYDIAAISQAAHDQGATIGWDLAHAVGNIELQLEADNADFAAWCTYKYLNGGPGAVGGYFVHPKHTQAQAPSLARYEGWWGNRKDTRFQPNQDFQAGQGAEPWQLSNVPVFSMLPLYASLPMFAEHGMANIARVGHEAHRQLREAITAVRPHVEIITPIDAHGSQLSLRLPNQADKLQKSLQTMDILCDTRGTDILRVAPASLYNWPSDLDRFVTAFDKLLDRI